MKEELRDRYNAVHEAIVQAARTSGRSVSDIALLCVTKFHPISVIFDLLALGHRLFGENYVQEAREKSRQLEEAGFDGSSLFHLIGALQRKKASQVVGNFAMVHSVDSQALALALEKACVQKACTQAILLEVNVGDEAQKAGVNPKDAQALAELIQGQCPHLDLQGLMCLPPVFDAGEAARPYFASLRTLRDELATHTGLPLPVLSMGMSGDFIQAIEEGATIVRIGTAIVGPRPVRTV